MRPDGRDCMTIPTLYPCSLCWVFVGVLTSLMRCAGIPSRPITNFKSAHDANGDRTIDYLSYGKNAIRIISPHGFQIIPPRDPIPPTSRLGQKKNRSAAASCASGADRRGLRRLRRSGWFGMEHAVRVASKPWRSASGTAARPTAGRAHAGPVESASRAPFERASCSRHKAGAGFRDRPPARAGEPAT